LKFHNSSSFIDKKLFYESNPLASLLPPVVCWHVFLGFGGRLADPFFVFGFGNFASVRVALTEHAGQEVNIPVFVEDQFALARRGVGPGILDLEQSGRGAIRAADLHNLQVGVLQHTEDVLTRGKFGSPRVELEWDVSFELSNDLRMRLGRVDRQGANESNEERQVERFSAFSDCVKLVDEFSEHYCFSSDLYLPLEQVERRN
jgi:hypothetical protein